MSRIYLAAILMGFVGAGLAVAHERWVFGGDRFGSVATVESSTSRFRVPAGALCAVRGASAASRVLDCR